MASSHHKISFIGFGEAAQAFAGGMRKDNRFLEIGAFDVKTNGPNAEAKRADYRNLGVIGADTSTDACSGADMVFSLVTADQAECAASEAAQRNLNGILFLDCNSCAPETKRRSAAKVEEAGGCYVDVAIMTPVHPQLHKSPCLLAGPDAQLALERTRDLGMATEIAGDRIGTASVRKMIRSVMTKGLEALTLECFLAGRKAGVEEDVLASLEISFPGFDWQRRVPYLLERAISHGIRRADEMQEVAQTLRDLEINPNMAEATAARQREAGSLGIDVSEIGASDTAALLDAILAKLAKN